MVKYLVVKVGGALMLALASATGFALDITQVANIGFKWWPLIAFGVFMFLVIWVIRDLYRANKDLLEKRSIIKVEARVQDNFAYLEVYNCGGEADFTAKARVVEGIKNTKWYYMYWDSVNKHQCHIDNREPALISVAGIADETIEENGICMGEIVFYQMSESGKEGFGLFPVGTSDKKKLNARYPTMSQPLPKGKCTLEVRITSSPASLKEFKSQRYILDTEQRECNVQLIFTLSPE